MPPATPSAVSAPCVQADEGIFTRLEGIVGREGLVRLAASCVMVLGLGGVGSSCAEALARGGVGHLVLVDGDAVAPSNVNRQAIAFASTIGRRKTEVMAAMVAEINPDIQAEALDRFVTADEVPGLLGAYAGRVDYVVDALDTVSTKIALAQYAEQLGFRLISSMGAANKLHPECLHLADLYDTRNCPLCRVMRRECRKRGVRSLRVLYSCEQPVAHAVREGSDPRDRSNLGTASFMPPIMGQTIAGAVIRELAELE